MSHYVQIYVQTYAVKSDVTWGPPRSLPESLPLKLDNQKIIKSARFVVNRLVGDHTSVNQRKCTYMGSEFGFPRCSSF